MNRKRSILVLLIISLLCFGMCACGSNESGNENEADTAILVELTNKVPDKITVIAASYSINGNTVGTNCVEIAGDKGTFGEDSLSFPILKNDIQSEKDLQSLEITIKIAESGGGEFDVATLSLPSEFGDEYNLELRNEDGSYSIWQTFDDGVDARLF